MTPGEAAVTVARRLIDPETVRLSVPLSGIATFADGLPGTALLHARLSHVDPAFERAARLHWDAAASRAVSAPEPGCGMYGVLGGLAASLVLGSPYLPDPEVTAVATGRAVCWLSACAVSLADSYNESARAGAEGTVWHVYDAISGLSGIGRVLLAALVAGHSGAERGLLATLDAMTHMLTDRGGPLPGWWVPTGQHPEVVAARLGPTGAADTGLAHGVSGPLALLSLAHTAGYSIAGQDSAIRDAVVWLDRWRAEDHGWPSAISGQQLRENVLAGHPGHRAAWCYGIPGTSRALLHAARALGNDELARRAHVDFSRLAGKPDDWNVEGSTLCHGYAGVLRCAAGINSAVAEDAATSLMEILEPASPFVFPHVEHGLRAVNPGFLTGAAGVALALAEHAGLAAPTITTHWDAALLIS